MPSSIALFQKFVGVDDVIEWHQHKAVVSCAKAWLNVYLNQICAVLIGNKRNLMRSS